MPKKFLKKRSSKKLLGKQSLWKEIAKVIDNNKSQQKSSHLTQLYLGDVYQSYTLSSVDEEVDEEAESDIENESEEVLYPNKNNDEFVHVFSDVYLKVNRKVYKDTMETGNAFGLTDWINFKTKNMKKQSEPSTESSLSNESELEDWQKLALAKVNFDRTISRMPFQKEGVVSGIDTTLSQDFGNGKTQFKTSLSNSTLSSDNSMRSTLKELLFNNFKSTKKQKAKEGKANKSLTKEDP